MGIDISKWLPKFLQEGLISSPALWGKLPSRGDFVRHNLKHNQGEALQAWISTQLRPEKLAAPTVQETAIQHPSATTKVSKNRRTDASLWHNLSPTASPAVRQPAQMFHALINNPISSVTAASSSPTQPVMGHAGVPWCFVLPPGTLAFAPKDHVIGVWMASSDKVGRVYPLVMIQTASPRWVKKHFSTHTQQPCDWLFAVAREMAKAVYADETQVDRATGDGKLKDNFQHLSTRLEDMWHILRPGWKEMLGRSAAPLSVPDVHAITGTPHPADPVRHLDGVRYVPWANWPQKLTAALPQPAFWQQDLQGRFVAATINLNS